MYAPTREQARQFLFDVWRKYQAGEPLSGLETTALDVILMHPEYHGMLADRAASRSSTITLRRRASSIRSCI